MHWQRDKSMKQADVVHMRTRIETSTVCCCQIYAVTVVVQPALTTQKAFQQETSIELRDLLCWCRVQIMKRVGNLVESRARVEAFILTSPEVCFLQLSHPTSV